MRIIGCGNLHRGDDGAGLLVARRLRELGLDTQEQDGEALFLMESWSGACRVILIDAVATGASPGHITWWDAEETPIRPQSFRPSTHAFGVAEAVELARALNRLPPRLRIYGIEGRRFDPGAGLSPEVAAAVEAVALRIAGEMAHP